jgi:hypothetical protein
LLSENGKSVNKASLSNIFEYTDKQTFNGICEELSKNKRNLQFVYWNLLQNQMPQHHRYLHHQTIPKLPSSCFYFKNIQLVKIS